MEEETQSFSDHSFKAWLIRTMGKINTQNSRKLLQHIWRDPKYDITLQYEAQEELVRSGAITDTQRSITFRVH